MQSKVPGRILCLETTLVAALNSLRRNHTRYPQWSSAKPRALVVGVHGASGRISSPCSLTSFCHPVHLQGNCARNEQIGLRRAHRLARQHTVESRLYASTRHKTVREWRRMRARSQVSEDQTTASTASSLSPLWCRSFAAGCATSRGTRIAR